MTETTTTRLIPREVIFGNPDRALAQISPDGTRLSYVAPVDGVLNVWVGNTGEDNFRPVTHDTDRGIRDYFWSYDNRHILYVQDKGGDENWLLYSVDLETGETTTLTPFENVQVHVVAHDKHFPNEILVALNKDDERLHDVYHLDLTSGELKQVARNPGTVVGWIADPALNVRAGQATRPDGGNDLLIRKDDGDDWKTLLTWDREDALTSGALWFERDGKHLYLRDSRDANAARLVRLDIETGRTDVIAEDPTYDVSSVVVHPDTYEVQMVGFDKARREWQVFDRSIAPDVERIESLVQGDFEIYDRTVRDDRWLIAVTRDVDGVSYYEYDRTSREGRFLFHSRPRLSEYDLAPMEPFEFKSRDGLVIHGYITFPVGVERTNLPVVLNVHGGPWARDTWGYDPEAQWLANRGYACLQVNYRGSTGYGKEFLNAGNKEWGGKMHDDLVDAVNEVVRRGYADPQRIAIYGGSYGGYAALVGATFTPDLFRCAVAIVGPSNLLTFLNTIPPYWESYRADLYQRVGNPETEREFLEQRSPINRVDRIRIPMLIAQGANDPRVKQAESEQIVAAMKEKGIDHEYLLFEDEGHGFAKPENRLRFYAVAERFLAKHLGGRSEESET